MSVKCYQDLIVWQKAIEYAEATYKYSANFPKDEIYGLRSQLRSAVVSIPSNIAEGQGRSTTRDFLHFLSIANGSLYESESQIIIAMRLKYLTDENARELLGLSSEVGRLLSRLRESLYRKIEPE